MKTRDDACDVIWIIKTIRGVMFKFKEMKYHCLYMIESISALGWIYQERQENTAVFYDHLVLMVDNFEHCSGTIGGEDELI